jgi:hypothetical protein
MMAWSAWGQSWGAAAGGTGPVILAAGLDGAMVTADMSALIINQDLVGEATVPVLAATIAAEALVAEIQDVVLTGDTTASELEGEV